MKRFVFFFCGLGALSALFFEPQKLLNRTIFYAFQARDLERASELLQGHWIFFGPEMTGGGNLMGPFYYFLLAPFLAVDPSWYSAWVAMAALALAGGLAAGLFLGVSGYRLAAALWVPLFLFSIYTAHALRLFINPSYLIFFAVVILLGICVAFGGGAAQVRRGAHLLTCLIMGLAVQLHFTVGFLLGAMLFMQLMPEWCGVRRLPWRTFFAGLVLMVVPVLPYLIWLALQRQGVALGQGTSLGGPEDVWPTLAYLVREVANLSFDTLAQMIPAHLFRVVPLNLPVLVLAALIARRFGPDKTVSGRAREALVLLRPLLVCAVFAFLPFSYGFAVPIANRYGVPFYLSVLLITVVLHEIWLSSERAAEIYNVVAGLLLAVLTVYLIVAVRQSVAPAAASMGVRALLALPLLWLMLRKISAMKFAAVALTLGLCVCQYLLFFSGEILERNNMLARVQWERLWTQVLETGWSLEELKQRLFFINVHIDGDPDLAYAAVASELKPRGRPQGTVPDGFFVATGIESVTDFKQWLNDQPVPEEIKAGLRDGDIEIGEARFARRLAVVPYFVRHTSRLPRHLHNWPLFYRSSPHAGLLASGGQAEGVRHEGESLVFHWNECPDLNPQCDTGLVVDLDSASGGRIGVRAQILGAALSQISPWIHPIWTQAWLEPYVEVRCGGHTQRFVLASSVGYNRKYLLYEAVTNYFVANNSLIAPFERRFELTCRGPVTEIIAGRAGSTVDSLRVSRTLPGRRLSARLDLPPARSGARPPGKKFWTSARAAL